MMRKNKPIFYADFHVLQTLPSSSINKDPAGNPNTALFGGGSRAVVSSWEWKRAMKDMFKDLFEEEDLKKRYKKTVSMIATKIAELTEEINDMEIQEKAENALCLAGVKNNDRKTDALLFISEAQAEALAQLAVKNETDEKAYKKAFLEQPSVDLAVFGGKVARDPSVHFSGAIALADSFSTHVFPYAYDDSTDMEDLIPEFNSAIMYRYATIEVSELAEILGTETGDAVKKFAEAFICSVPARGQNTFESRTAPDMVYMTIQSDLPTSFSNAFACPVKAEATGYVESSKKALAKYAQRVCSMVREPKIAYVFGQGNYLDPLGEKFTTLSAMFDQLEKDINDILSGKKLLLHSNQFC